MHLTVYTFPSRPWRRWALAVFFVFKRKALPRWTTFIESQLFLEMGWRSKPPENMWFRHWVHWQFGGIYHHLRFFGSRWAMEIWCLRTRSLVPWSSELMGDVSIQSRRPSLFAPPQKGNELRKNPEAYVVMIKTARCFMESRSNSHTQHEACDLDWRHVLFLCHLTGLGALGNPIEPLGCWTYETTAETCGNIMQHHVKIYKGTCAYQGHLCGYVSSSRAGVYIYIYVHLCIFLWI